MSKINIRELRVIGTTKDYSVRFDMKLNIIAGEISTGKSSILDFIDYCLGAGGHPKYQEIQRKGRAAFLEIEINGETFVIERQLFSTRQKAQIHFCDISTIELDHEFIEVSSVQKREEESISSFILSKINLWNIPLKESPAKDSSDIDIMSLRDVLWFSYLKRDRIAGSNLLFEDNHMKAIKLRQVFDVLFGLHSNRLAFLSSEISRLGEKIQKKGDQVNILLEFTYSQEIPELEELEEQKKKLNQDILGKRADLDEIDSEISGKSGLASGLRQEVLRLQSKLQQMRVKKRNYEKTLQRLIPLRGQYSEDISKLHFLKEAKRIIDPLGISTCPICLSSLDKRDSRAGFCPLCGERLPVMIEEEDIDVSREIRTIERKLRELGSYVEEVEQKIRQKQQKERKISNELSLASKRLDDTLKRFVSPYLSRRDELVSTISRNQNEIKHIEESIKVWTNIGKISEEKSNLAVKVARIKKEMDELLEKSPDRTELINSLSRTFLDHLSTVKFPKLANAYIDEKLVPFVRGIKYGDLLSDGAINLASICWMTSIYSEAIHRSRPHPGFLILDNVQRGIGIGARDENIEFRDESIVKGIYTLLKKLVDLNDNCQIIVVDNHPPSYMSNNIVVYYSGKTENPPYGFIDDEVS
jgi:DNA repair ATPase RecN